MKKLRVDYLSRMNSFLTVHTLVIFLEYKLRQKRGFGALIPLFFMSLTAFGQVESMYSLYRLNPLSINSAEAGLQDSMSVLLVNRLQWLGMEGAPKTLGFAAQMKWKRQSGLGMNVLVDEAGPVQVSSFGIDYAYHTKLSARWNLSGGIRVGLANVNLNFDGMSLVHGNDDAFGMNQSTGFRFNTGWGLRLGNEKGTYFSISQPRLLKYDFGDASGTYLDVPYFYASAGSIFSVGQIVHLIPSVLIRFAKDVPLSYDVNVTTRWKEKLDVGISYRNENSLGFLLGIQATSRIYFGYIYENPISVLSQVKLQTHELALRFRVK